jgi:type VI secretion system secreted protein VgrG
MHNKIQSSLRPWLVPGLFIAGAAVALFAAHAKGQSLGAAETFAVLGATTVTNTGASQISGSVGVSPGTAITGFGPGIITNGALHAGDATATQAHADLATAYTAFAGLFSPPANNLSGTDLGGKTLTPGVYRYDTSAASGGVLTFDAQNNPNARFVVQIGTTLITSSSSSVALINGADARNVYFQVGTSATLGTGSTFIGNILADASITTVSGTNLTGRLLAVTGAVTLDTNNVTSPGLTPSHLLNLSTRANVLINDNVLIGGFIITGDASKKVIVRAIGPSLTGVSPLLADPVLELHGSDGSLITSNDNWKDTQLVAMQNSGLAPTNDLEPAIIATLAPGAYTAIVRGKNGTTGIGLVEIYDVDVMSDSRLGNLSTRSFVQVGDEVMIAGFIFGNGTAAEKVIIRALGPSLTGVANLMADPTLALYDGDGTPLISDDNWKDDPSQQTQIIATGLAPSNDLESAIVTTLPPGAYTAIVAGKNGGTGVALAEVFHLP